MNLNKLIFNLNEFEHYNNYFKEYYYNEKLYLFENSEKYKKSLNNIKEFFKNNKNYLTFYDEYDLRVICDLIIYSYYKELKKESEKEIYFPLFPDKVINRMRYFSGGPYYNMLSLVPKKLIKDGKIIDNFLGIANELNKNYSKEITEPEEKSMFNSNLLEKTLKSFEYDYKSIFFKNSENLNFIDKFINLDEKQKNIIEKQLHEVFLDSYKKIQILNEISDYKSAKMYREAGINRIKIRLKELLKQ